MIVLPDRSISRAKFLVEVPKRQWMTPSVTPERDECGNHDKTLFRVRGRLSDGYIVWTGWFECREDFDAFLWAVAQGNLNQQPALWRLPTPEWRSDIGEQITFDFATTDYRTTGAGTDQTYTRPADWNDENNNVQLIAGGSGGSRGATTGTPGRGGGGGGAYSRAINITIGAAPAYRIGAGGAGAATVSTAGGTGGDSWFNGTALGAASVSAQGSVGTLGQGGVTGGQAANGLGSTKFNGGNGGNGQATNGAGGGGGGAGGATAAGGNGTAGAGRCRR